MRMLCPSIRFRFCSACISGFSITCSASTIIRSRNFARVLEMNPRYYLAHAMMGPVYAQMHRFDEALPMLSERA